MVSQAQERASTPAFRSERSKWHAFEGAKSVRRCGLQWRSRRGSFGAFGHLGSEAGVGWRGVAFGADPRRSSAPRWPGRLCHLSSSQIAASSEL